MFNLFIICIYSLVGTLLIAILSVIINVVKFSPRQLPLIVPCQEHSHRNNMFNGQCISLFSCETVSGRNTIQTWTRRHSPSYKTSVRLFDVSVITASPSPHNCNLNLWQPNTVRNIDYMQLVACVGTKQFN